MPQLEPRNVPGVLARLSEKPAANEINLTCGFQTAVKGSKKAAAVLAVSEV